VPAKQRYEPQGFLGAHAECPRLAEPKLPRQSRLPTVDECGVIVVLDAIYRGEELRPSHMEPAEID
jgi:hypothetical protein